jgi:hypothetical protein
LASIKELPFADGRSPGDEAEDAIVGRRPADLRQTGIELMEGSWVHHNKYGRSFTERAR